MLKPLMEYEHPDLLVGLKSADDAAVYRLSEDQAIIQTLDFFPPIVDDPYTFGAIAAANAMSDVYAMGGEVLLALNIAAFPDNLPREVIADILRGGAEKVSEAGGIVAGGHTIFDREPKYGLCVTGVVHPGRIITKDGAKAGDRLVLTKALGVGLITTALKERKAKPEHLEAATLSMLRLNRGGAQAMQEVGVSACTDITGYALLGHAWEMAERSGVGLKISLPSLPILPGALGYARDGFRPGGLVRNREFVEAKGVQLPSGIAREMVDVLFCPETSGGLLISVPQKKLERLLKVLAQRGQEAWVVGEVVEGRGLTAVV